MIPFIILCLTLPSTTAPLLPNTSHTEHTTPDTDDEIPLMTRINLNARMNTFPSASLSRASNYNSYPRIEKPHLFSLFPPLLSPPPSLSPWTCLHSLLPFLPLSPYQAPPPSLPPVYIRAFINFVFLSHVLTFVLSLAHSTMWQRCKVTKWWRLYFNCIFLSTSFIGAFIHSFFCFVFARSAVTTQVLPSCFNQHASSVSRPSLCGAKVAEAGNTTGQPILVSSSRGSSETMTSA